MYDSAMAEDLQTGLKATLAGRDEIALAYLFGSTARGDASALSDVDVGIVLRGCRENLLRYRARLSESLSRAIGGRTVQVVLLEEASPALAARAIKEGHLLVCRDDATRVRFEIRAIGRDLDTAHLRRLYDQALGRAVREGRFYG